jgi:hypothetical protein
MGKKTRIVVILGMHRCGTSLLANFLNAIGIDFGRNFLPHDEWNAEGYWENKDILAAHEEILKVLKSEWKDPRVFLEPAWLLEPEIRDLKARLIDTVRSETTKTKSIWGFKDPRTSVLLPIWWEIFTELEIEPSCVLAVRSPASVAASLGKRDGLSDSHSQLLWLKYSLNALAYSTDYPRVVTDYDRWFDSGHEQARMVVDSLKLPWPVSEEKIAEAVNLTIRPQLRHHRPGQSAVCSPFAERLYVCLSEAAANGTVPESSREIVGAVEEVSDVLGMWGDTLSESESQLRNLRKLLKYKRKNLQISLGIIVVLLVILTGLLVLARI